jgi:hypothetical protein
MEGVAAIAELLKRWVTSRALMREKAARFGKAAKGA